MAQKTKKTEDTKVKILFDESNIFELSSNNPELDQLVKMIVSIKDKCDFSNIKVVCDKDDFDKYNFEEILKKSINDFIEEIKINHDNLEEALKELEIKD